MNDDVEWPPEPPPAKLHRPWRALIALAEVVVAAVAVWFAFRCWDAGVKTLTVNLSDGTTLTSTRYLGNWMAGAIGLGTLAAILLVEAVREVLLAVRARHRKKRKKQDGDETIEDYVAHLNEA
ncbi:hypothetical protein FPZ12_006215 [Amycolatopsis acidicola]|uniref:Uncharacterized protein n=1 Tax=Amycolatopsis acidicola TaxID=2596893 RepID=A0A5N0VI77_9PSEU|nr:hypothetical protein [Amycolatopsis acidicola]KAA9164860.1 hypothetical protein FPZ12_006215 [Amycolatopsis acidicola]